MTFRGSDYYADSAELISIIAAAAAKASTSSDTASSGPQGAVAKAPFVRKKRTLTASGSNTIVTNMGMEEEEKEKEPTVSASQAPEREEAELRDLKPLRRAPEGRMEERLASIPFTFRDSLASSIGGGQQVAQIVSSYTRRGSDDSTVVGQGALKAGKQLDVTSFLGGQSYSHQTECVLTTSYISPTS